VNKSGQSVISLDLQLGPPNCCCEACTDSLPVCMLQRS
jgi:hypothetical protein